jgi:hypothetical protein
LPRLAYRQRRATRLCRISFCHVHVARACTKSGVSASCMYDTYIHT